jgi:GAF domain-containing protein
MGQQHLQPDNEERLVALGRTLQTLREEENADVLIETTLDYLQAEFKYRLIWIGLYDRLDHRLFGKGGITPTGDTRFLKQWFNLHPGDLLEQVVIQQRPVGIPDLRQEIRAGEWRRIAEEFGIQGTILLPLRCKDRCFGVTLLGSHLWGVSPRPAEKAQLSLLLGGLAAALYQIEVDWQRSAIKRPDQTLFQVLDQLMQVPTVAQRLEALVTMTQQFVAPTRTNLYWYSPEQRYFWHRVGNRQSLRGFGGSRTSAVGLTVAEASDFYQALGAGQLVSIGAGRSLLNSESTERLLARLRTRSLLAAPIQARGELLGFLAVEDNEARIWEEAEKNYVRATGQMVAMVVESEEIEATLQETQQDTHFAAEIAKAISRSKDTTTALKDCAGLLCNRLDAERFLVLQADDNGQFTPIFQQQPLNRRPLTTPLAPLSRDEQQLLLNSTEVLMIEDLEEDSRLDQWRESLIQLGVRSLLICQTSNRGNNGKQGRTRGSPSSAAHPSQTLTPLLVIGHGTPRTWNPTHRDLVSIVAQQIDLLLLLGQLQDSARVSFRRYQTLQAGLSTLSQAPLDPVLFERAWVQYLATLLECPLAVLLSWTPESPYATVAAAIVSDPRFALPPDLAIPVGDTLIQEALATSSFLSRPFTALGATTRKLLSSPSIGQLLVISLYTGATPTTGILLLADNEERQWPRHLLLPLETLTQQFSWFRHYRHQLSSYQKENEQLQTLNWYKHRCLETLHQSVRESITALLELEPKTLQESLRSSDQLGVRSDSPTVATQVASELKDSSIENSSLITPPYAKRNPLSGQPLQQMRRQQLLHQLEATLAVLTPVLKEEQWQMSVNLGSVPLASPLKRSLHRVEPLYNQRQLMLQVHNPGKVCIYGDPLKLECILFELLVRYCFNAPLGSWINLWCGPISPESKVTLPSEPSRPLVELLIAESGLLNDDRQSLTSSPPKPPPSLNLKICQDLLRSWGGDLQFYQLEGVNGADQKEYRYSSRLLLPLAT